MAQHEPAARIEAFYRNGWLGSAKRGGSPGEDGANRPGVVLRPSDVRIDTLKALVFNRTQMKETTGGKAVLPRGS
jgi:hypothetical protein